MTTLHVRITMTGEGVWTGTKYRGIGGGNTMQVYAVPEGGAYTYNETFRMHDIVQGSTDNGFFTLHARWTINANGRVASESFNFERSCRG
jgi:hypothetical protein